MKKKFIFKTAILSIITAGLIGVYFVGFRFLEGKSQKIADRQVSIDTEINKTQQSFNVKRQIDSVEEISQTLENHFLKSSDVPAFLNTLELIGSRAGSDIVISSVEEANIAEVGNVLSVKVGATGSYQSLYKTLSEIENLPYLTSVSDFSISSTQNVNSGFDKSDWSLSLSLLIISYTK